MSQMLHAMKEFFLAVLSILFSIVIVILVVAIGWYFVWKLFLSKFRFIRELMGGMSDNSANNEQKSKQIRAKKVRRD